jgi:murein DD-endopeptidase MepM/ murein hydrolase activator NlpD
MKHLRLLLFFVVLIESGCSGPMIAHADATSTDVQSQIAAHKEQVDSLKADIAAFQKQLDALGTKKNTLQSTISSLALGERQLVAQIALTQGEIDAATLQIQQLTSSIGEKESSITMDQQSIANQLRSVAQGDQMPLVATLMSADSLDTVWQAADEALQFNQALANNINDLQHVQTTLASNRAQTTSEKTNLLALQSQLTEQKHSVEVNKAAEQQLLAETKNQESNYQKLIAQKQASEQSFENELNLLQSQLILVVNPNSLPKVGTGILSWPFSTAFMVNCSERKSVFGNFFCITQYFGNTPFSTANPQVYSGHGHDGVDISAPIGTPVHAALAGVVLATGNTDLVHDARGHQCYSFGKWVMLVHGNGINTMYAHLSEIDVSKGQAVTTGTILGLSGMTGYATGPHLHFGVYATDGTEIMTLRQFRGATIGCADATMPVATLTAYLNPLSYL